MGSFNLSCSLSGLSIGPGDPAVVLLMESATRARRDETPFGDPAKSIEFTAGDYIYPSEGVTSLVFLPVFGIYADYGDLTWDLTGNPHLVDAAAVYDINELMGCHTGATPTSEQTEANARDFPDGLFAIWIHGDVWTQVVAATDTMPLKSHSMFYSSTVLEALGFTKTGITGMTRYTDLYTRPDWNGHAFGCDGSFGHHVIQTETGWKEGEYSITLPDVVTVAAKYSLPISLKIDRPWRHVRLQEYVAKTRDRFDDYWSKDIYDELIAGSPEDKKEYWIAQKLEWETQPKKWHSDYWGFIAGGRSVYQNFCRLWAKKLVDNDPVVIDITSQFQAVSSFFYCAGRLMIPTHGGPQCGEPAYSLILGDITSKIASAQIKERYDYEDDDYDGDAEEEDG